MAGGKHLIQCIGHFCMQRSRRIILNGSRRRGSQEWLRRGDEWQTTAASDRGRGGTHRRTYTQISRQVGRQAAGVPPCPQSCLHPEMKQLGFWGGQRKGSEWLQGIGRHSHEVLQSHNCSQNLQNDSKRGGAEASNFCEPWKPRCEKQTHRQPDRSVVLSACNLINLGSRRQIEGGLGH